MVTTIFRLSRPKQESSSIYMRFHISGKAFQYGIGKTIETKYWKKEEGRPYNFTEKKKLDPIVKNHIQNINSTIDKCRTEVKAYESNVNLSIYKRFDFGELRNKLDHIIKGVILEDNKKDSFAHIVTYANKLIEDMKSGVETHRGKKNEPLRRYSDSTIKTFSEWVTVFKAYEKKTRKKYKWNDIDNKFGIQFQIYLGQKYSVNTTGKHMKNLKTIMSKALKADHHTNLAFKQFSVTKSDPPNIYLTKEELKAILNLQLDGKDEEIRDLFILGCMVGQSFTDYNSLDSDSIVKKDSSYFWKLKRRKSEQEAIVPLDRVAIKILKKYDWSMPKQSLSVFNLRIKEIAREADIIGIMKVDSIEDGRKVSNKVERCELVSSHTARRTAITNWYLDGIPTKDIMTFSGHSSEDSLMKYIKITKEQTADRYSGYSFFGPTINIDKPNSNLKVV